MDFSRRDFIKLGGFITVSLAAGSAANLGCDGMSASTEGVLPRPDGGVAAPDGGVATGPKLATGTGWKFPQSVASGDPKPDGAILWTRVVPSTADDVASSNAADFLVRVRVTDADNASLLGTSSALTGTLLVDATVLVQGAYDHTIRHKVMGLAPGQVHYFQVVAGGVNSKVGRFKTAPAEGSDVAQLKVLVLTCQDWTINHWGGFEHMVANETADFVLHLGDYIYETTGESFQAGTVETRHDALVFPVGGSLSTSSGKFALTIDDYRYLYKKYRSDSRLQALHERFAFVAIWDDHEFSDDCWRDAETYDNGTYLPGVGGDNTHQLSRRRAANQAWFENMPADVNFDAANGYYENISIYRELKFGKLAHLILTDERLYRADHMIPEAAPNPATGQPVGRIGARYFVPEDSLYGAEAQKIAGAGALGFRDSFELVSMLGKKQREWWKDKMKTSTATWKLWGNEVSLLRVGINGTDALATLVALNSISTLATQISTAAASTAGNIPVAAAIVCAVAAGASQATAGAAATAIATADATSGDKTAAAVGAGLTAPQAGITVAVYGAAKAAAAGGAAAQVGAGAQTIAFGLIAPDIKANKANSRFIIATGKQAALAPFFMKFLINADMWDGYDAERRDLMAHLKTNSVKNVVALTGDLHSFLAGTVSDDYRAADGGTPVMVDIVTAGMSSDSFFSYLKAQVGGLSADLATLVYYPLSIPVAGVGTLNINFNLLDYTFGKTAPNLDALAEQARRPVRAALAQKGVPEAQLDATTTAILTGLKADASFNTSLLGLAQQLAGLNSNPWLKYVSNDAQGYVVATITPTSVVAQLRQLNGLVGSTAPTSNLAKTTTVTVAKDTVGVTVS